MASGTPLFAAPLPCVSCPYRVDCPSGLWDASEYAKLSLYDDNEAFNVFCCHQQNATGVPTVCRGWLTVHAESAAARLAVLRGDVTDEQRYAPVATPLHRSGAEAAEAGLAGIDNPSDQALALIDKLVRRGAGRYGTE